MTESLARLAEEAAKALTALAEGARAAGDTSAASTPRPVTSEEAWRKIQEGRGLTHMGCDEVDRAAVDAAMPLLARDHGYVKADSHGLLTPEEVERRAREWYAEPIGPVNVASLLDDLISALTRPASAGSTAPGGGS